MTEPAQRKRAPRYERRNIALSNYGEIGRHYAPGDVVADWPDWGDRSLVVGIKTDAPWFGGYGVVFEGAYGATAVGLLRNGNCGVVGL